jgi:UDP-2,3-diacylglucosamine hydrolase
MELFNTPITINGNCYFASDFHLGAPNPLTSSHREKQIIAWLNEIKNEVQHLFLLGDIFDFWFEYKHVIPKGFHNFIAKLEELRHSGTEIYFFTGNHDMWVSTFFTEQLGIHLFRKQQLFVINGKNCLIGHGDGLGSNDFGYKMIKYLLNCSVNIWLYSLLPSRIAFPLAHFFSRKSRAMSAHKEVFLDEKKEPLLQYCKKISDQYPEIDYFIYGHRHIPLEIKINYATYFNTGDWLKYNSYLMQNAECRMQLFVNGKEIKELGN